MTTSFSPWPLSCLLSSLLLLLSGPDAAHSEKVEAVLGLNDTAGGSLTNVTGFVSASASWSLRLETEGISNERAIRVSTSSSYSNLSFPLLISVRQGRHISSWTLPFIEAGHASPVVSKTLCPLFNKPLDDNSTVNIIYIDVSTPAVNNVSFNVSASIINQYQLRIDNPVNEVVSASSPVSYVFEYPEGVDRVLVKVTSGSTSCALVSVQEGLCPLDQLLDYPDHRGTFQTMQLLAAINIKRPVHQNFIYIVVSVYHHDNCSQTDHDFFDGLVTLNAAANYNPVVISSKRLQELSKTVTIEISHTLSYSSYALACVLLVVAFGSLVIGIGIFFIIDEFCCHHHHATHKFLAKLKEEEGIEDIIFEAVDGGEVEGRKRKRDKCISCLGMTYAIICGRYYTNELNKLKKKEGRKRKRDKCISCLGMTCAIICGRHYTNELNKLEEKEKKNQRKENDIENGVTGDGVTGDGDGVTGDGVTGDGVTGDGDGVTGDGVTGDVEETDSSPTKRRDSYDHAVSDEEFKEIQIIDSQLDQNTNTDQNHDTNTDQNHDTNTDQNHDTNTDQNRDTNTDQNRDTNTDQNCDPNTDQNRDTNAATNSTAVTKCDRFCSTNDPYINELTFVDGKKFQSNYNSYWIYLSVIVIFYSLPVYQLMLTYQRYVSVSGNEDFCYYNTLCSHPLLGLSAFNNVWSNVSFLFLGILFLIIAKRRRSIYCAYELINIYYENKGKPEMKVGVPQYFGIYYASGIALIGEALMSGAYHICPTGNNYQFDTTMMFVLVTLGIYQLFKSRNPDITPSPCLLLILSLFILFIALGVIYPTLAFYIIFFFVYELGVIWVSLQLYHRWKVLVILKEIRTDIKCAVESEDCTELRERFRPSPPADCLHVFLQIRFFYLVGINVINFLWSLFLVIARPQDFATNFLILLIVNYLLSLLYVFLIKLPIHHYKNCGRRKALLKPFIYFAMSVTFWLAGFSFYTQEVTNWLDSPAVSRNDNKECFLLGFYDTHDMWHICSAFGIFFSFLLMMTLEDHVEFKKRSEIRVY